MCLHEFFFSECKKNSKCQKKISKKKFLAQNSIFNVDYENISDYVFTQIFFSTIEKITSLGLSCVYIRVYNIHTHLHAVSPWKITAKPLMIGI